MYSIRPLPGRAPHLRLELHAHLERLHPHDQPVQPELRRRHRRRQRGLRRRQRTTASLRRVRSRDCMARGPYCGDAHRPDPAGGSATTAMNLTTYGGTSKVCGPGCKLAPYCGDGIVSNGEQCDKGTANGTGLRQLHARPARSARVAATASCRRHGEQCDDGMNNGAKRRQVQRGLHAQVRRRRRSSRASSATTARRTTPAATASATRTARYGPRCGDGIKNGTEQCDDGKNDGSYGTCKADCTLAAYCGDGILQQPAGDVRPGRRQQRHGLRQEPVHQPLHACSRTAATRRSTASSARVCDDGVNSGQPGSCTPTARRSCRSPPAATATIDPGEQCDDGANNGTRDGQVRHPLPAQVRQRLSRTPASSATTARTTGAYGTCNPELHARRLLRRRHQERPRAVRQRRRQRPGRRPRTARASAPRRAPSRRTAVTGASRRSSASSATAPPRATAAARTSGRSDLRRVINRHRGRRRRVLTRGRPPRPRPGRSSAASPASFRPTLTPSTTPSSVARPASTPTTRFHGVVAARHRWRARVVPRPPTPACCNRSKTPEIRRAEATVVEPRPPPRTPAPLEERDGRAAFVVAAPTVVTATLTTTGAAKLVAPHVLSMAHWDRLLDGELYAPSARPDWRTVLKRTFDVDLVSPPLWRKPHRPSRAHRAGIRRQDARCAPPPPRSSWRRCVLRTSLRAIRRATAHLRLAPGRHGRLSSPDGTPPLARHRGARPKSFLVRHRLGRPIAPPTRYSHVGPSDRGAIIAIKRAQTSAALMRKRRE